MEKKIGYFILWFVSNIMGAIAIYSFSYAITVWPWHEPTFSETWGIVIGALLLGNLTSLGTFLINKEH